MDKATYKLLNRFYKQKQLSLSEIDTFTNFDNPNYRNSFLFDLFPQKLVSQVYSKERDELGRQQPLGIYKITSEGRAFVEEHRRQTVLRVSTYITAFATLATFALGLIVLLVA